MPPGRRSRWHIHCTFSAMSTPGPTPADEPLLKTPADFSLVLGGPMYQLWRGTRLPGDTLQLLRRRIIAMAVLAWAPLLLLVFASWARCWCSLRKLAAAKCAGLREYGTLAQRYAREFDRKWLRGGAPGDEALVGSADIQSLADLANSFEVVKDMRAVPFTVQTVVQLAVTTLVPVVPLMLTMISLEQLLERLLKIVF